MSDAGEVFTPNQPTSTRVVASEIRLETGPPPFEARGGGGISGRSKYKPIFDQVDAGVEAGTLGPGTGWVKFLGDEKALAHLRTALKRQGGFSTDVVKVRHVDAAKTTIAIYIPKDADMADLKNAK